MNVNKKFDRFKQWAGERMGGEAKTNVSDDFKTLETEMALRHEGMERLQKSMTSYVKSLSQRNESEDKEKVLPVAYMGSTMISHGEEFENDSEFGNCLISMGRANERIARMQETYITSTTNSWLESTERSLAQMKEYQAARKKLESRRLAYDASLAKMQKAKKEDFRVEEELRSQKAKYEESSEDVYRRMQDIKEAEVESVADLGAFLDAELHYYDRCREVLVQLKREWPAGQTSVNERESRRHPRSRSNTAHSYADRFNPPEEEPPLPSEPRPTIRSNRSMNTHDSGSRPVSNRAATFEGPTQLYGEPSPSGAVRMLSVPNDSSPMNNRPQLRPVNRMNNNNDLFGDPSDDSAGLSSSPDRYYGDARSVSPATSHGSGAISRSGSSTTLNASYKKAAPPPPPSRAKKPPPPPPMKRSALSSSTVPYA